MVGYVGEHGAASVLIGGLRRLEFRVYDSAGMASWDVVNSHQSGGG